MKRFKNLILMLCLAASLVACDQDSAKPEGGMGTGTGHDYSNGTRADVDTRREPAQNPKGAQQSSMLKE